MSQANIGGIRARFPILAQRIGGRSLVYLDNAATTQKPQVVVEAMERFYESDNANVKRGMHELAERATEIYERARDRVREFIHARSTREIVFTKNATEGINLVARSWGEANLKRGDAVLLTLLEHHSNIVPWLQLKEKLGIEVEWVSLNPDGMLKMEDLNKKLKIKNVKIVAVACVSNVLGTITPFKEVTKISHECGAKVLLDAAQLVAHAPIDVQDIGCDFLVFSGHKIYGPTGIGVLYGKEEFLSSMPPFLGGGTMIHEVKKTHFTPAPLPEKFEAGTPPIAEARGLHVALDFVERLGWEAIQKHEQDLLRYTLGKLRAMPFVRILGPRDASEIASCISFVTPPVHPHDLTEVLGRKGICLRAGHHCAMPLHEFLGVPATTRMSVAVYNTWEDIDRMCEEIEAAYAFFFPSPAHAPSAPRWCGA
jgi:cysteine desulfurase/selenocysteine lyase